jgi:hypothetical protein
MIIQDFLPEDKLIEATNLVASTPFRYGRISTDYNLPIFGQDLDINLDIIKYIVDRLNTALETKFEPVSAHFNLQINGVDGAMHNDIDDKGTTHAFNLFLHDVDWTSEMGGYLLVGNERNVMTAILPVRNTAVLLDADIDHKALAPSNRAGSLERLSLTVKLRGQHKDEIYNNLPE